MSETSTTAGARAHARAQAGDAGPTGVTIPASAATDLPPGVAAGSVMWDETIGAGGYTSSVVPRHTRLRIVDLEGDGCASLLVYNAQNPIERLNVADTVKVQWQAYLGEGSLLLSDMGRVLMSITEDTCEVHDTFCGASTERANRALYGEGSNHGPYPNGRDRFALALARHGLGKADIMANVNLFKGVRVDEDGSLRWLPEASHPGAWVELRAEMDVLVVVANTPHVLDPRDRYVATPLRLLAYEGPPAAPDDPCRVRTPEAERAYLNTEDYLLR